MRFLIATITALGLFLGTAGLEPLFAQGKGGGKGKQGTQKKGKGQKGKKTGPQDGSGPIHTPPQPAPPK